MSVAELEERKRNLEKILRNATSPEEKRILQNEINSLEIEIMNSQKGSYDSVEEKIGAAGGAVVGGATSFVYGEIKSIITGHTDEKDVRIERAKVVDASEKVGATIGGIIGSGVRIIHGVIKNRKGGKK